MPRRRHPHGHQGRTAPGTPTGGGRYFKYHPPLGLSEPLDGANAAQIAVKDCIVRGLTASSSLVVGSSMYGLDLSQIAGQRLTGWIVPIMQAQGEGGAGRRHAGGWAARTRCSAATLLSSELGADAEGEPVASSSRATRPRAPVRAERPWPRPPGQGDGQLLGARMQSGWSLVQPISLYRIRILI